MTPEIAFEFAFLSRLLQTSIMSPPKRLLLIPVAAVSVLFTQPSTAAATIVSTPDYTQLLAAINSSTNIQLAFDGTIQFPAPIHINKSVEIDASGRNIIFDGAGASQFFRVTTNGALTLKSITLQNGSTTNTEIGSSGYGGAIVVTNAVLSLINCTLNNNWARGVRGVITVSFGIPTVTNSGSGLGGAIAAFASQLRFVDCDFVANGAYGPDGESWGGGLYGWITAAAGRASGGAVFAPDSSIQIERSTFRLNWAHAGYSFYKYGIQYGLAGGGAISAHSLAARASLFEQNSSRNVGGAVDAAAISLSDCAFVQNSLSNGLGGAVHSSSGSLAGCFFASNSIAGTTGGSINGGGAVYYHIGLDISATTFLSNRVVGGPWYNAQAAFPFPGGPQPSGHAFGGAVAHTGSTGAQLRITNCIFFGNSVRSGDGDQRAPAPGSRGGAISTVGTVQLLHSTFASNFIETPQYPNPTNAPFGSAITAATNAISQVQASIFTGPPEMSLADGTFADGGFNISSDATPAFTHPSSLNNTDPLLEFVPTARLAIVRPTTNSPAINRVTAHLTDYDIRGALRPETGSDSGAVELETNVPFTITPTNSSITIAAPTFLESARLFGTSDFQTWTDLGPANTANSFTLPNNSAHQFFKLQTN